MTQFAFMAQVPDHSATRGTAPESAQIENTDQSETFTKHELIFLLGIYIAISLSVGILIGIYLDDIAELLDPLLPFSPICLIVLGVLTMSLAFYEDPESGFKDRLSFQIWPALAYATVILMAVDDLTAASKLAVIITALFVLGSDSLAVSLEEQPRTEAPEICVEYLKPTFLAKACTALALFVIAYLLLCMDIGESPAALWSGASEVEAALPVVEADNACQLFDYLREWEEYAGC